jgi:MFS family permease
MQKEESIYSLAFWLLCLSNFLFCASFSMIIPELPDYLASLGGREYIGYIIALFTLTAGLSRPFSGKLTDHIGRIPVMAFGSIVCFICGGLYPLIHSVQGFLLLRFFHGMSTGTKPTATSAYVADIIPESKRGEAQGGLGIFTATGMSIGPVIGSFLADELGLREMFWISSLFALLSILILTRMKERNLKDLNYLINKPPRWNEQVGAYVLNFNGRVTMASVKNFQLVDPDEQNAVVLQFGRVGKDDFTMDLQYPISPFQAFAVTLSSFDSKIACD